MAARPPLDSIDPADAWRPWHPSPADPWTRKWAAHLYRRAAFGPSRSDLLEAERLGPDAALDRLLRGWDGADETLRSLQDVGQVAAARDDDGEQIRAWWVYVILQGGHPLREKMTLFWHNHFATSLAKVQSPALMFRQNNLLRAHALGRFGPFVQAVSRDPAMLVWLDSDRNVKGHPNENYARELMELFTLGVGNYTEQDVREAARAFTGWHTDGDRFAFEASAHDAGAKTVLGRKGPWDGGDVVRIVLEQPAAARLLVRKLYQQLVSERPPPGALLEPLCDSFRKSDYDVTALLRTMLSSRHFYSDHAFRRRIKDPVEFVIGAVWAVRGTDTPLPPQALVSWINATGQVLFAPPNVKGWPGGRTWLNTSTVLQRDNFARALATGTLGTETPAASPMTAATPVAAATGGTAVHVGFDTAALVKEARPGSPDQIVRVLLGYLLPGGVRPEARERLTAFLGEGNPTGAGRERRIQETVHAVLTMPEYQLA